MFLSTSYPSSNVETGANRDNISGLAFNGPSSPIRLVRIAQAFLYVVSSLQLLTAFIGACVLFRQELHEYGNYIDNVVLMNTAFLGICGVLGVVVAKGGSRVCMAILIGASVLVGVMSCIVINGAIDNCDGYSCDSVRERHVAIEALSIAFIILGIIGTSFLLCLSFIRKSNTTL
jgi:hypothetical protein